jgi:hypothetical protein
LRRTLLKANGGAGRFSSQVMLELELGLPDRLQLRAGIPVSASPAADVDVGFAYDFSISDG